MPKWPAHTVISPYCQVDVEQAGILIGDDNRMNGLDHPAIVHTAAEAQMLVNYLQQIIADWPTKESK